MSNYPPPGMPQTAYPQPGYPPPPQPSGCGCGGCLGKFFIVVGVLFFLIIAVCCGGSYLFVRSIENATTYQQAEVQTIGDEIAPMQIPAPLQPVAGGRYKIPFTDKPLGQGAIYGSPDKKALLIVASFTDAFGPQFKDQLMKNLSAGPSQQTPSENDDLNEALKNLKESTVERTINGETAQFHITQGEGIKSGTKKIRVNGAFQGNTGPAMLIVGAEEATLSREKIDEIIKSIGGGQAEKK